MFRTNRFFQNLILMMCVLFDMGCTSIQKPLTTPIEQTPSPMTILSSLYPTIHPTLFLSPLPVRSTLSSETLQTPSPGNSASISLPTLTTYPPTKSSSFLERQVTPILADSTVSNTTFLTYTPTMPHVNAGFYDGDLLYFLSSAWKNKLSWFPDSIFTYNFKTEATTLITTSVLGQEGVIDTLAASQDWLSWDTHLENGNGWQLFARNLKTGKEILVDRQEDTGYNSLRGPYTALSGNLLVWSTVRINAAGEKKGTVMLIDLDKGIKKILAEDPSNFFGFVGIDHERVVWSKGQFDSNEVNVYMHDLATGKTTQLTDDDRSYQPQIRGEWVVWRHGFGQIGPISILNLKTGERMQLDAEGDFLRIGDGLVLWWTYLKTNAYVYDIRKNILYPVFDSYDFQPPLYIYNRSIVAESVPEQGTGKNYLVVQSFP